MRDYRDVGILIDGYHRFMVLETGDEWLAIEFLRRLSRERALPLYHWTQTDRLGADQCDKGEEQYIGLNRATNPVSTQSRNVPF